MNRSAVSAPPSWPAAAFPLVVEVGLCVELRRELSCASSTRPVDCRRGRRSGRLQFRRKEAVSRRARAGRDCTGLSVFVASVAFCLRHVGARQQEPGDSINKLELMEVQQQSQRHVQQSHVAQQLRFVDGQNVLDAL